VEDIIPFLLSETIGRVFAFSVGIKGDVVVEHAMEDPKALLND